jgi:RNA polymerase sigma factor (sigma-70 family)
MARSASTSLVRHFETLWGDGTVVGLTDRQLLERFNAGRDPAAEAAFAALVRRHGPMVLGLCRQVLRDPHHAEDAFQAVFLVLARRAPSIHKPDLLANWLYGVSLRTARHAKARLARGRTNEGVEGMTSPDWVSSGALELSVPSAEETMLAREQTEGLHREIERLPKSFRVAVVLRYFEGLSLDEIAGRMDWPVGTVRSRLARARDKLRLGLTRRGLALPAGALGWALSPRSASAFVPSPLCDTTTTGAIHFAAGHSSDGAVSTAALILAREVGRTMVLRRISLVALKLLLSGSLALCAGYVTRSLAMTAAPRAARAFAQTRPQVAAKPANDTPAAGRMFVAGRVLDPQVNRWPVRL